MCTMWSTAVHITQQRPGPVLPNPVDTSITASHVMAYYSDTNTGNTSVLLALQLTLVFSVGMSSQTKEVIPLCVTTVREVTVSNILRM